MKCIKNLPDWAVRAIKTFIQAFFGVLVPELIMILQQGLPSSWSVFWACIAPVCCSGLAAAISALWNLIKEDLEKKKEAD